MLFRSLAGSPAPGQLVNFRVQRVGNDPGDTLVATAKLLGVMIGYVRV